MNKWMEIIHGENIYEGFPLSEWNKDVQGWGYESPIFESMVKKVLPRLIVEVGSWKGASAMEMAWHLKKNDLVESEIICVDTWMGSGDTWIERDDVSKGKPREYGRPTIYYQFIANIIHSGHTDIIVPVALDSLSGAQFLTKKALLADAIYVDAGHDYQHALSDIKAYWPLVRPGGVLFGDDYSMAWIGVIRAVNEFAEAHGLTIGTNFPGKWYFFKPDVVV